MMLAFKLTDIITIPFGYLLGLLFQWTDNYGVAMILFAVIVQLVLLPITAKSKKSMMAMSRLTPRVQAIQKKYADDPQRQNEAINALYKEEGVSMGGGCLWSFVPLLILIPLFTVIREPITYILMETKENAELIVKTLQEIPEAAAMMGTNVHYAQVSAAQIIPDFAEELKAAVPTISERTLAGITPDQFTLCGINMGDIPQWKIFNKDLWAWDWRHIGAVLVALLSAGNQIITMLISQRSNDSLVTNEKGVQDKEAAKNSQSAQSSKMMMWMMPIMSLWIGFTVPCVLSLYWFVGGVIRTVADSILTKHYRKIYDAEDAIRLQKAIEQDKIEAEKERIRAEKRAANPDGITENTSKKKMQKKLRAEEEAAKAAAAREYAAKKGIVEEAAEETTALSGIADRPYCKGRAYDPNRYSSKSTEEE